MSTWPTSLPQSPLLEDFKDRPQDSVLRSSFDGWNKQRNRFTAAMHEVTEKYYMTRDQYKTFVAWYEDTLGNGAEEFLKEDPIYNITKTYKFSGPYEEQVAGIGWYVTLQLEKLP